MGAIHSVNSVVMASLQPAAVGGVCQIIIKISKKGYELVKTTSGYKWVRTQASRAGQSVSNAARSGAQAVGNAARGAWDAVTGFFSRGGSIWGDLSRAADFGFKTYRDMRDAIAGTGLHAHHIIEKRLLDVVIDITVAVTKAEHQIFTNLWRNEIAYGLGTHSKATVWEAAQVVYKHHPIILDQVRLSLGF